MGVPLAPKARAGRRWRHGYYTVLGGGGGGAAACPGAGAVGRVALGCVGGSRRRDVGSDPVAGGGEVSTLRSGHPCRRRRRRVLARLSLPSGSGYTYTPPPRRTAWPTQWYRATHVVTRPMRSEHDVTPSRRTVVLNRARVYDDRKM